MVFRRTEFWSDSRCGDWTEVSGHPPSLSTSSRFSNCMNYGGRRLAAPFLMSTTCTGHLRRDRLCGLHTRQGSARLRSLCKHQCASLLIVSVALSTRKPPSRSQFSSTPRFSGCERRRQVPLNRSIYPAIFPPPFFVMATMEGRGGSLGSKSGQRVAGSSKVDARPNAFQPSPSSPGC